LAVIVQVAGNLASTVKDWSWLLANQYFFTSFALAFKLNRAGIDGQPNHVAAHF
jgi:hypothetical protein